jgi:MoxR-like ATPase
MNQKFTDTDYTELVSQLHKNKAVVLEQAKEQSKIILGNIRLIVKGLAVWYAGGHILLEAGPGLAKTLYANSFGRVVSGCVVRRIQFIPDMQPSDITGFTRYRLSDGEAIDEPGPLQGTHICLGDEINRARPETQSALLQAMQERAITRGGQVIPLSNHFMVIATLNEAEKGENYRLPLAQLSRFSARMRVPYPDRTTMLDMAELSRLHATDEDKLATLRPIIEMNEFGAIRGRFREYVRVAERVESDPVYYLTAMAEWFNARRKSSPREINQAPSPRTWTHNIPWVVRTLAWLLPSERNPQHNPFQARVRHVHMLAHEVIGQNIQLGHAFEHDGVSADHADILIDECIEDLGKAGLGRRLDWKRDLAEEEVLWSQLMLQL